MLAAQVEFHKNSIILNLMPDFLQTDGSIYFYSVKEIEAQTELLVWYSREYGMKLENITPVCTSLNDKIRQICQNQQNLLGDPTKAALDLLSPESHPTMLSDEGYQR